MPKLLLPIFIKAFKFSLIIFLISSLLGCGKIEKVYEWKKNSSAIYKLRYKIIDGKRLTIIENHIVDGKKQVIFVDGFQDCQYFNDANWTCEGFAKGKIVMLDGNLTWNFWGEVRRYEISPADTFAYTFLLD